MPEFSKLQINSTDYDVKDITARSGVASNASNIAVQAARIDQFTHLKEGSTTGDAELMDIRVGADGVTYTSAGAAVRANVSNLKSHLKTVEDMLGADSTVASGTNGYLEFDNGVAGSIPSRLIATLKPQQSGSGNPSATNVRAFISFERLGHSHYNNESGSSGVGGIESTPFWGGTFDCLTGRLSYDYFRIPNYDGTIDLTEYRWWSDRDVYVAGTNPSVGATVLYKLSTPLQVVDTTDRWGADELYNGFNGYYMYALSSGSSTQYPFTLEGTFKLVNPQERIDALVNDLGNVSDEVTDARVESFRSDAGPVERVYATLKERLDTEYNRAYSWHKEVTADVENLKEVVENIGGLSDEAKIALLNCFQNVAWINEDGQTYYDALHDALYPSIASITATFTQGSKVFYTTDSLNNLKPYLVVQAVLSDGSVKTATGYTLSGTLTVGMSVITVSYGGKTTTFNVVVSTATLQSITALFNPGSRVFYTNNTLDDLKQYLTVTANYSDSSTQNVTNYMLSGSMAEGTNTITVRYQGMSDTFTVTVQARPDYITAVYTQPQTTVYVDEGVDALKNDLVVTYYSSQGATGVVLANSEYTLSGTLVEGTNTISVEYQGLATTFNVTNVVDFYNILNWSTQDNLHAMIGCAPGGYYYTLGYSSTAGPARCSFWASRGLKTAIISPAEEYSLNDYPIPIPEGATSVIITCSNYSSAQTGLMEWTYDKTNAIYNRVSNIGWMNCGVSYALTVDGENKFLTINLRKDTENNLFDTGDPIVSVVFTK